MRMLLLTTLMIFVSSAYAGLYKWVDDEGNVHYSQKRPIDKQFKRLKAPAPAPEKSKSPYQSTNKQKQSNDVVASETAKNEKIRVENCTKAKKSLENFTIYRRFKDKDGNISVMDDKVRAQQIENAKQAINNFCN